jgi:alpha-D-xyloside xylohydrolase
MRDALIHYDRLRYRLLPYIYTLAAGTYFDDGTIMRPLVMDFESDRKAWGIDDEYMFGKALLVAPVTEFQARSRQVYLPAGADWIDANTGQLSHGGQTVTAAAPRERMPLFVRAGSIVPLGPQVEWSSEDPQGTLTVHVFAGADADFTLYEDDGTSTGYARGEYSRIPLHWDDKAGKLTIGGRQGSFPGMAAQRKVEVVIHRGNAQGDVFEQPPTKIIDYSGTKLEIAT